jgi:response regulator of citrate/malate metabolism
MKPIRILITEDDPMVSFIIGRLVNSLGDFLLVGQAQNGREALDQIRAHKVDLVLLDLSMPEVDGKEVMLELRNNDMDSDVIIITSSYKKSDAVEALRLGAWDYIVKPFSYDRLRVSLDSYKDAFRYRASLPSELSQEQLDRVFYPESRLNLYSTSGIQRGDTAQRIMDILSQEEKPLSAGEIADKIGISRITVRKYCEALVSTGRLISQNHYQPKGRPIKKYQPI